MQIDITAKHDAQKALNVFKLDPDFEANEAAWKKLADQWLGTGDDDGSGSGSGSDDDDSSGSDDDDDAPPPPDKPTQVRLTPSAAHPVSAPPHMRSPNGDAATSTINVCMCLMHAVKFAQFMCIAILKPKHAWRSCIVHSVRAACRTSRT